MSDITFPHSFLPGGAATASEYSKNLYNPKQVPDSFDVVNGFLDNDNREAGWDIDYTHVRSLSMANGRMVGTTANSDYLAALFPVEATAAAVYKEMTPISGASISFYCPVAAAVGVFTWQHSLIQQIPRLLAFLIQTQIFKLNLMLWLRLLSVS